MKQVNNDYFKYELGNTFFNHEVVRHIRNKTQSTFMTETSKNVVLTNKGGKRYDFDMSILEFSLDALQPTQIVRLYDA